MRGSITKRPPATRLPKRREDKQTEQIKEKLKIVVTDNHETKVFVDGVQLRGVTNIEFKQRLDDPAGDMGDLKIELVPFGIKVGE